MYNNTADGDNNDDNTKETAIQMKGGRDSTIGIATS
jgi:hypothetical protein